MTIEERQGLVQLVEALFLEVVSLQSVLIHDHATSDWEFRRSAIQGDARAAVRKRFRAVYDGITARVDDSRFLQLLTVMQGEAGAGNKAT